MIIQSFKYLQPVHMETWILLLLIENVIISSCVSLPFIGKNIGRLKYKKHMN